MLSNEVGPVASKAWQAWYSIFGDTLITTSGPKPTADVLGDKKVIGLYFSASWCGPCKRFTPTLSEMYQKAKVTDASAFECVFLSACNNQTEYEEYKTHMPFP